MNQVTNFYIDGFNLYHGIKNIGDNRLKWMNYRILCNNILNKNDTINKIMYFTAYADFEPEKKKRHIQLIKALKTENIEVVFGKYEKRKHYYVEKRTDVNLAINLIKDVYERNCDKIILLSGDSDFIPAIKMAKEINPKIIIGVVIPPKNKSDELKSTCDFNLKLAKIIKKNNINNLLFPPHIDNTDIYCPKEWL